MTAVTGPPEKLVERREELTPMLAQYVDLCEAYDDAIVLFRVGDFYKSFCETADEVARVCELTRIEREDSTGTYTAAGIPVDNASNYLERLLAGGYRVAVADQVEDPEETSGLVDRAVTQILTPGTVVDDDLLSPDANYVAAVLAGDDGHAVAFVDVSTGDCAVTQVDSREAARDELDRVEPAELLRGPGTAGFDDRDCMVTDWNPEAFDREAARETLSEYLPNPGVVGGDLAVRAVGGLLAYAEYTQGADGPLAYVARVRQYDPRDRLRLDAAALESLELFENRGRGSGTTLVDVLDETTCALGRRRLHERLRRPFVDRDRIEARLDAVAELVEAPFVRTELRDLLGRAYDLERLIGRVSRGRADARDLRSLHTTLEVVPELREALSDVGSDRLVALREELDELPETRGLIDRALVDDPPQEITEGGLIAEGFDEELDELRATEREGRQWVADLEAQERERTGIDNLEVGHNQVHGYYIEVTNGNLEKVPDDYRRRQTLKHSERFVTPELKRREEEIFGASERADSLEYELFCAVRDEVATETERVQALADALATLDTLTALATVAVEEDYCRPTFHDGPVDVEGGRHPVVERTDAEFVPNDAHLPRGSIALITGPNMSGKSTYMRQVALHVVMAQAGSFVPAQRANLPIVDRVFTRVGASDDIAGGQSTFMREMSELSDILHDATADSLVLLDEVGRGTSTTDGQAIARAAVEFIHDEVGATTLFATHYHDLTSLAGEHERVFNLHFTATREGDDVTFLHRVAEGASSSSYGVEVARMAGVPERVVDRSRELVVDDDGGVGQQTLADVAHRVESGDGQVAGGAEGPSAGESSEESEAEAGDTDASGAGSLTPDPSAERVAERLREVDVAHTTPLEALNLLEELRSELED